MVVNATADSALPIADDAVSHACLFLLTVAMCVISAVSAILKVMRIGSGDGVRPMSEPVMEADGIAKTLGEGAGQVQALKGRAPVKLNGGELALLMGPSGSGKTTLLSVLGCIMAPSTGSVRVCGHSTEGIRRRSNWRRLRRDHIGFIFQSYHLFPTLTAVDNVRLALDVRGDRSQDACESRRKPWPRWDWRTRSGLYPRELSAAANSSASPLRARSSGGPRRSWPTSPRRLWTVRTGTPSCRFWPTSRRARGTRVLVVTHDPRTVPYADRIIRIEDGEIVGEEQWRVRAHRRDDANEGPKQCCEDFGYWPCWIVGAAAC